MKTLELAVNRVEFTKTATIGRMYADGVYQCDTLEDTRRDLPPTCPNTPKGELCKCKEKVYGETCIPAGRYRVVWKYSPKFKKNYPALENAPHFLGILIHAGSNTSHSEGCILVGWRVEGKELLQNQFVASTKISKLVQEAASAGKEIFITIKE